MTSGIVNLLMDEVPPPVGRYVPKLLLLVPNCPTIGGVVPRVVVRLASIISLQLELLQRIQETLTS